MAYVLTLNARTDLDEILAWIEIEMRNPQGAEVVKRYLFAAFDRIGRSRGASGHRRPDLTSRPVKFLTERKYVIIFDDRVDPVAIIAVAGATQDLANLLSVDPRYLDISDD